MPPPLGYGGINIDNSKLNKIIYCLNIRSYKLEKDADAVVYFPEVMWSIFHSIIGNNEEKVQKCEQVQYIMKELRKKYKGLGKTLSVDRLCGNKYYKNEMTVSKYLVALQIYRSWKTFDAKKKKMQEDRMKMFKNPSHLTLNPLVFCDEIVRKYCQVNNIRLIQQHINEDEEAKMRDQDDMSIVDQSESISNSRRSRQQRQSSPSNIRLDI